MIINDHDLKDRRSDLIAEGKSYFTNLIKQEKFQLLERCMEELYFSEEERNNLKSQIHINIDYMRFIKQEEYDRVDKYLEWAMKKVDEREKLKHKLKFSPFSVSHLCSIWSVPKADLSDALHRSARFLRWLFDTEEDTLAFKVEMLTPTELHSKIVSKFVPLNHFEIIEKFLEWCLLSADEIFDMKTRIVTETALATCKRLISGDLLFVVEHFMDWAFKRPEERAEFARHFILSDDGILSCCNLIRKCKTANVNRAGKLERFEILFNLFFHNFEVKEEFKVKCRIYVNEFISERVVEDYLFFLDVLDAFQIPGW